MTDSDEQRLKMLIEYRSELKFFETSLNILGIIIANCSSSPQLRVNKSKLGKNKKSLTT